MFLFGHLGIGSKLVSPWAKKLPKKFVLLGTILPDLIDKTLYYSISWTAGKQSGGLGLISGKNGSDLGIALPSTHGQSLGLGLEFIPGTRTFGHTALFVVALTGIAVFRKSRVFAALALGCVSHLVLDSWMDSVFSHSRSTPVLWPLAGWEFPPIPYANWKEHLESGSRTPILVAECIGVLLLAYDYWKTRYPEKAFRKKKKSRRVP